MPEYILELQGITKIFPGVRALNNVHFQLKEGEVHALMGENGAGKSTFIKIITGVLQPEEGQIFSMGKRCVSNHLRMRKNLALQLFTSMLPVTRT